MDRVNGALLYLSSPLSEEHRPGVVHRRRGAENARVVRGTRDAPQLLADDVSRDAFFRRALGLPLATCTSRVRISRALQASGSCPIPRRCRVASDPRSSMSSSGSRAFAASSASRTAASRSPFSTHARAQSCWTPLSAENRLRARPAGRHALPRARRSCRRRCPQARRPPRRLPAAGCGCRFRERLDRRCLRTAR